MSKSGKLILKSSNASKVLTTQVLADIVKQEAHGEFDTKTAIPGHVQQGGLPSPIGKNQSSQIAIRSVQFIEDSFDTINKHHYDVDFPIENTELSNTAAVLGVKSSHLKFTSIRKLYDFETELGEECPRRSRGNSPETLLTV